MYNKVYINKRQRLSICTGGRVIEAVNMEGFTVLIGVTVKPDEL